MLHQSVSLTITMLLLSFSDKREQNMCSGEPTRTLRLPAGLGPVDAAPQDSLCSTLSCTNSFHYNQFIIYKALIS